MTSVPAPDHVIDLAHQVVLGDASVAGVVEPAAMHETDRDVVLADVNGANLLIQHGAPRRPREIRLHFFIRHVGGRHIRQVGCTSCAAAGRIAREVRRIASSNTGRFMVIAPQGNF